MQHVPKHVGEETDRADGDAIQARPDVEANFLLRRSVHLGHKLAQKDQVLSIHHQKGPERDNLTCLVFQNLFGRILASSEAAHVEPGLMLAAVRGEMGTTQN